MYWRVCNIERNVDVMSENKKDNELKKKSKFKINRKFITKVMKLFGIVIVIWLVALVLATINFYFSFSTSYTDVHSYVIDGQKMVLQEKYLNHNPANARYRVKVYSLLQDGKGLPTWKYVKTVDYGHEKPQLAYQNEIN